MYTLYCNLTKTKAGAGVDGLRAPVPFGCLGTLRQFFACSFMLHLKPSDGQLLGDRLIDGDGRVRLASAHQPSPSSTLPLML